MMVVPLVAAPWCRVYLYILIYIYQIRRGGRRKSENSHGFMPFSRAGWGAAVARAPASLCAATLAACWRQTQAPRQRG